MYRDRDREGYRSPEYGSRSRSYSPGRGHRQRNVQESREVMMHGLPVDMAEEDVGQLLPSLTFYTWRSRAALHLQPFLMARG